MDIYPIIASYMYIFEIIITDIENISYSIESFDGRCPYNNISLCAININ